MKHLKGCLWPTVGALLLSGCVSRVQLKSEFWTRSDLRVGIALTAYPKARAHRAGSRGLLDELVNEAGSENFNSYLQSMDISSFAVVRDLLAKKVMEKGLTAKTIPDFIDLKKYEVSIPSSKLGEAPKKRIDYKALADQEDIDVLLLISVVRYGTLRKFYGFIPLGDPKALFQGEGQMLDLKNRGKILWRTVMDDKKATVVIERPWNEPPDYPNLNTALHAAMEQGRQYIVDQFSEAER